jgi:hypothetical protein
VTPGVPPLLPTVVVDAVDAVDPPLEDVDAPDGVRHW